ncbi:MAG: diguanylate cyclase domain-containing protein [Gammaproteobacteria bacterium]
MLELSNISVLICELPVAIDGFGLLERIRSATDKHLAARPVLLLVGESDRDNDRESAFQLGATDFINMPFASTELTTRVRLHAQLFVQFSEEQTVEMQQVAALNVLQQLSQQNYLKSLLKQELSFSLRHRSNVSICKLKVDNLKAIVASFDKSSAVSIVQAVAKILQQTLRREDILCYLEKAEFCVLFPVVNAIGAFSGINRIRESIARLRIRIAGKQVSVTLSGAMYSCVADETTSIESVNEILDRRLAEALRRGGNCIVGAPKSSEKRAITVDRALQLIANNNTDDLAEHARGLVRDILPLLEYAEQRLELEPLSQSLRDQLNRKG